jgi:hypothetical protein
VEDFFKVNFGGNWVVFFKDGLRIEFPHGWVIDALYWGPPADELDLDFVEEPPEAAEYADYDITDRPEYGLSDFEISRVYMSIGRFARMVGDYRQMFPLEFRRQLMGIATRLNQERARRDADKVVDLVAAE